MTFSGGDPRPDFEPAWPVCSKCRGVRLEGHKVCVAHLGSLSKYQPAGELDLRGVAVDSALFDGVIGKFYDRDAKQYVFSRIRCDHTWFSGKAWFYGVRIAGEASFDHAHFSDASFENVVGEDELSFALARFGGPAWMVVLAAPCISLDQATFAQPLRINFAATDDFSCFRTEFDQGARLLRCGTVAAGGAVFGAASSITETKVTSLEGTDVGDLVLTDVDLSECGFLGALRLDQLRLDGRTRFATPAGRWRSRRRMLADEPERPPEQVAGLYRSLRKSFEDSKNEAGAGDFYYGEMEARRHSKDSSFVERAILAVYWALSGYGQRASRALAALAVVVAVVAGVLVSSGQDFGLAARVALGTALSKDPGVDLTAAGEWTVLVARFLGPVLLALAVLAVRARVKR